MITAFQNIAATRPGGQDAPLNSRSGITLVAVLGFISLLLILGVSLMATTRTERLATSSYADVTRARQLTYAAMARAIEDIDARMVAQDIVYPSSSTGYVISTGSGYVGTNFLENDADLYIPGAAFPIQLPASIPMTSVSVSGTVVGRIGYYAVDCSGLLDANLISTETRGQGRNPGEIPLSPSILAEVINAGNFLDGRSNYWQRFESVPEMFQLGIINDAFTSNQPPISLFPYSHFKPDLTPDRQPKIYLGGSDAALMSNEVNIVNPLQTCQVPNPGAVFSNLLDYVDTDYVPKNLKSFCTEAVPMINEVIFSNTVTRQIVGVDTVYTHRVYLTVETWFPFSGSFANAKLSPAAPPITFTVNPVALRPDPATDLKTAPAPVINHGAFSYQVTRYEYVRGGTNISFVGGNMAFNARFTGPMQVVDSGDTPIDEIDLSSMPAGTFTFVVSGASAGGVGGSRGASVVDPRLNFDVARWSQQQLTVGDLNQQLRTTTYGEGLSPFYVRDFPMDQPKAGVGLGKVAELGYLSVGEPWRTVALYNTPAGNLNPVLDYFTTKTNVSFHGLVNINTPDVATLASAFYDMPIEQFPGDGGPKVTVAASTALASRVISALQNNFRYETNRSISAVGEFDNNFCTYLNGQLTSQVLTNDALRESLIRNSHELLGVRQNFFTVFAFGQAITQGGVTGAEQRAVSVIWRDPEPTTGGDSGTLPSLNKTYVRFFKWL